MTYKMDKFRLKLSKEINGKPITISVTLFEKESVKPELVNGIKIPIIYLRVIYERNSVTLRSLLFKSIIQAGYTLIDDPATASLIYYKDLEVIKGIIEKQIQETNNFDLERFKYDYPQYARNVLVEIKHELFKQVRNFLDLNGFPNLSNLVKSLDPDIFKLFDLLKEIENQNSGSESLQNTETPLLSVRADDFMSLRYSIFNNFLQAYNYDYFEDLATNSTDRIESISQNEFYKTYLPKMHWDGLVEKLFDVGFSTAEIRFSHLEGKVKEAEIERVLADLMSFSKKVSEMFD